MSSKAAFGVRLDDETIAKLKRMAVQTDRTMGSVIRMLIRMAEVKNIPEVSLNSADTERQVHHD